MTLSMKNLKYILYSIYVKIMRKLLLPFKYIPKQKNMWVFLSSLPPSDNLKYLFLYISNEKKEIKPYWVSKNLKWVIKLNKMGYNAIWLFSPKAFFKIIRAGVLIVDRTPRHNILFVVSKSVNIWHGAGIKKIEWDDEWVAKNLLRRLCPEAYKTDYIITSSEKFREIYSSAFKLEKENIISCKNQPKAFVLHKKIKGEEINACTFNENKNIIVYLPTFRLSGLKYLKELEENKHKISHELEKINGVLIIKLHPNPSQQGYVNLNAKNIKVITDRGCDIYPLLRKAKMLISDYSSVMFEFAQTNKPIVMYMPDEKEYIKKERGFYFDIHSFGFLEARNIDELIKIIKSNIGKKREYRNIEGVFYESKENPLECIYEQIKKIASSN